MDTDHESFEALQEAIRIAGSQTALANLLDPPVKPQAVQQWKRAPDSKVLAISKAVGYHVPPHRLRRDLYPHPDDGLPLELRGRGNSENRASA